jgi:hypothetical protein
VSLCRGFRGTTGIIKIFKQLIEIRKCYIRAKVPVELIKYIIKFLLLCLESKYRSALQLLNR